MKLKNCTLTLVACAVALGSAQQADAVLARYVQIYKNETPDTRFHLSELEVFTSSTVPDDLGGGSFGGLTTSTNDHLDAAMVAFGSGNLFPTVGTTTTLEHGLANRDPNNVTENVGNVWSTANNQATNAQYTLDLGSMVDVTTIRAWPRADTCCSNRWQNLEVRLYADDGAGNPGAVTGAASTVAPGGNVPQEWTFAPVPEPSALALLGLSGLAFLRRRRR